MVIDTSALIAILTREPSAERLAAALDRDTRRLISAATVVELSLVMLGRYGEAGDMQIDRLLTGIAATAVPVGDGQVMLARDAALRFGRGRHPAALNFGDCFSYALSVESGEALLRMVSLRPGARHWDIFLGLCRRGGVRGNLVEDADHAALAIEHRTEWISTDRDFARVPALPWRSAPRRYADPSGGGPNSSTKLTSSRCVPAGSGAGGVQENVSWHRSGNSDALVQRSMVRACASTVHISPTPWLRYAGRLRNRSRRVVDGLRTSTTSTGGGSSFHETSARSGAR